MYTSQFKTKLEAKFAALQTKLEVGQLKFSTLLRHDNKKLHESNRVVSLRKYMVRRRPCFDRVPPGG